MGFNGKDWGFRLLGYVEGLGLGKRFKIPACT